MRVLVSRKSQISPNNKLETNEAPGGGGVIESKKLNAINNDNERKQFLDGPAPSAATGITGIPAVVISETVKELIQSVDVKAAVAALKEGKFLMKYCHHTFKKPHERVFWVDMEALALKWSSPKKGPNRTQIFLTDVERIVPGVDSDFWAKRPDAERRLGIELLCRHNRKLRLLCSQHQEWCIWLRGLLHAHQKALAKRRKMGSLTNDFIRKQWALADLDNNGSISLSELVLLLQRLNCRADVRYAAQLFQTFDEDGSAVLEYEEFRLLIQRLLTHEDLTAYFHQYKDKRTECLPPASYRRFLANVQQVPSHLIEKELKILEKLDEPFRNKEDEGLTELGFSILLTNESNSLIDPIKRSLDIQNMNYPLTHYWIASSHNTYLTGDQMMGKSAVSQYIDVLLKGCRCVELDCWDGSDGEPVIYHGHTLTSKIPFAAVVRACRDYGFASSPYPVILSLEMHCSWKQKRRVGEILNELLGARIYKHRAGDPPPTPQQLKGFFLVKGRVPDAAGVEIQEGNEEDLLLDEEELQLEILSEYPIGYCTGVPQNLARQFCRKPLAVETILPADLSGSTAPSDASLPVDATAGPPNAKAELSVFYQTISLSGRKLGSLDNDKRNSMDICSLNERRFERLAKTRAKDLARFHQKCFSRIYPSGTRVMSSNYNPMLAWALGAQMVALNYQALGLATLLNLARFVENGGVGYVLKPPLLRSAQPFDPFNFDAETLRAAQEVPMEVTIEVLAGQQLPRPSADEISRKIDTACPYVVLTMQGLTREETTTRRTHHVANNGLNPRWRNERFTFIVTTPSLAILVFEVRHYDTVRSDFLAAAACPVHAMRPGIRWVSLYDSKLHPIPWAGILVFVSIKAARKHPLATVQRDASGVGSPTSRLLDGLGNLVNAETGQTQSASRSGGAGGFNFLGAAVKLARPSSEVPDLIPSNNTAGGGTPVGTSTNNAPRKSLLLSR